jgi:hypothetical protein
MQEVMVVFLVENEDNQGNIKIKKTRENVLVPKALSPEYAIKRVAEWLKDSPTKWEIKQVKESNLKVVLTEDGEL